MMEIKTQPLQLKDIEPSKGIYTGYASTYTIDDGDPPDIVEPGAFAKTIQENGPTSPKPRIKVLYQHDFFSPIGKPLVLKEDSTGLYHESQIAQTTLGKDVLTLMAEGVISEQSIGFDTIKSDMDSDGVRHLRELKLWEYSPVTWGMNANTPILGVKSLGTAETLAERIRRAEKAIHRGELSSEDLVMALEQTLPLWREELKRMDFKNASGKTTWPLAPEDTVWNGDEAHKRILAWATGSDNKVDWTKYASCYFWFDGSAPDPDHDGLPDRVGDYKLPFCDVVDGAVKAVPRGIMAVAGVLQGSMGGVDIPDADKDAIKAKVATYYKKMGKTPPWESGGKAGYTATEFKAPDFNQLMNAQQLSDAMFDMRYALREAIQGALFDPTVTDKVAEVSKICDQFKAAVIAWTQKIVANGALGADDENQIEEALISLGGNGPGESKAGRVLSQANMDRLKQAHEHLSAVIAAADTQSSEPSGKGAHSGSEPDPEVVHSIKDMLQQMKNEAKKRGVS